MKNIIEAVENVDITKSNIIIFTLKEVSDAEFSEFVDSIEDFKKHLANKGCVEQFFMVLPSTVDLKIQHGKN